MHTKLELQGKLQIRKRNRKTGVVEDVYEKENTVTTNGKHAFLDETTGSTGGAADELNGTDGALVLYNSTPTQVFAQSGTDEGPSHINVQQVYYEWHDTSTDAYTPDSAEIRMGGTSGTIFANISGLSLGSKPSTQIWEYRYTLEISTANGAFIDDASGDAEGLDSMLMIFSGASGNEWGSSINLNIYDNSEVFQGTVSSPTVTRNGTDVDFEWTSSSGSHEFDWQWLEIASELHVDDWPTRYGSGKIPMWYTDHDIGTKPANTERIFTWTLSI